MGYRELVESFYEKYAAGDFDGASEIFDPDVETVDPLTGSMIGVLPFRAYGEAFKRGLPDARHRVRTAVESGDTVVVEGTFSGTHTAPLMGPSGELPPTGRTISIDYCDVFRVRDGRIVFRRVYYDLMGMFAQFGIATGAPAAG